MRALPFFLIIGACSQAAPPAPPPSPCRTERFESSAFIVCDPKNGAVEIRAGHRDFAELQRSLGARSSSVAFAMNGGMFDDSGAPIGLMIEEGREVHPINRRKGFGNFHLMPNGVFLVRKNGKAAILTSDDYRPSKDIAFATQSGPMLLIDGKLHPRIEPDGASHFVRNGAVVDRQDKAHFVISLDAVSFGKFARFLRDRLDGRNALFFDGSVSSLWDPANNRMDMFADLGPMVVVFSPPAESAPHREAPARP